MIERRLAKYLLSHGSERQWSIAGIDRSDFTLAVVIPACAESTYLPATLSSLATNPKELTTETLICVVVNQRKDADDALKQDNRNTLEWLKTRPFPNLHIGIVDATSEESEFESKDGVGLARKIGFDLCLSELAWERKPILISLDADTLVDKDYLATIRSHFQKSNFSGAVIPYRHQASADHETEQAIRLYELYLRSYLYGLTQSGSPYAYHTIGSAFCCLAEGYLKAGGMNRRLAAEDFYFLQKLAKTSGIELVNGTVVAPAARFSSRVPFGTGPTLQRQVEEAIRCYQFVGVKGFSLLKQWLRIIADNIDSPADKIISLVNEQSEELIAFLTELNFVSIWHKLQNNHTTVQQRLAAFHVWFDALRTRQMLTRCAEGESDNPEQLVAELLQWGGGPEAINVNEQLRVLECLQGVPFHSKERKGSEI